MGAPSLGHPEHCAPLEGPPHPSAPLVQVPEVPPPPSSSCSPRRPPTFIVDGGLQGLTTFIVGFVFQSIQVSGSILRGARG